MDHVEELLRDTLTEAAGQAPLPQTALEPGPRRPKNRRALVVTAVAAAVAVIAVAVPLALDHETLGGQHATDPPTGPSATRTEPPGAPMALHLGAYLSSDRRTLYAEVTESNAQRGALCWSYVDGTSRLDSAGVATVRLTEHVVFRKVPTLPPGFGYACTQPAVGGPWYSRIGLARPYDKPFVIDGVTGKRHRILGTLDPRPDQIVNWP